MQETKKLNSGTYFIKGAKWWDKINGNTYFSAYAINQDGEKVIKINFQYGYGSQYYYETKKAIESLSRKNAKLKFIDLGANYMKKQDVKNYWY